MDCPLIKLNMEEMRLVYKILHIFNSNISKSYNLDSFYLSDGLDFSRIKNLLMLEKYEATDEQIYKCIQYLYITRGMLVKDSFIGKEDQYRLLLDKHFFQSSYQEFYQRVKNVTNIQRIILISDTHIGNKNIEDYNRIRNVYNYAKQNDVNFIFHLGDLFDKMNGEIEKDFEEIYLEQLNSFIDNYPIDVMTYCVLGNHDVDLNTFFQRRMMDSFDLRGLSYYNSNFYMFPKDETILEFGDQQIHFAHRLYFNWIIRNMKIKDLTDMYQYDGFNSSRYSIHICGHLHKGFICSINDDFFDKQNLYIGVPSLGKENNGAIAIQLDFNYSNDNVLSSVVIVPLYPDNSQVVRGEEYLWFPKQKNKEIKKCL